MCSIDRRTLSQKIKVVKTNQKYNLVPRFGTLEILQLMSRALFTLVWWVVVFLVSLPLTTPEWTRLLSDRSWSISSEYQIMFWICFENFNLLWYVEQSWWICFECYRRTLCFLWWPKLTSKMARFYTLMYFSNFEILYYPQLAVLPVL